MSANGSGDAPVTQATASSKTKKNKKRKNKQAAGAKQNGDSNLPNELDNHEIDNVASDEEIDSPAVNDLRERMEPLTIDRSQPTDPSNHVNGRLGAAAGAQSPPNNIELDSVLTPNADDSHTIEATTQQGQSVDMLADTERRLEAAANERDQLRAEVIELRKSLEEVQQRMNTERSALESEMAEKQSKGQQRHADELSSLQSQLEHVQLSSREELQAEIRKVTAHSRAIHDEDMSQLLTQLEESYSATSRQHEEEIAALKNQVRESEVNAQQRYEQEVALLRTQFNETQLAAQLQHDSELSELRKKSAEAESSSQQQHDEDIASLRAQLDDTRLSTDEQHALEISGLKAQLEELQSSKDHVETRYQKLLGQVNTIKSNLGERLKADAAELSQARSQIEELEEQIKTLAEDNQSLQGRISELSSESEQQALDISNLRSRGNLSQQNWAKERDDLLTREAQIREEFEAAKQAMQDWEVLAMEERSIREGLGDRASELEEQLSSQRLAYERAASDRDSQSITVDGLQRALQEIQEARKIELREMVESTQAQLDDVRKQLKLAEETAATSQNELEKVQTDLERALPFEKEVKEKNLLIGKLRHEAVILNDHLTKALRFLKKGKTEDTVDRQLVTNYVLQFLALDRADPKKFQVLQLIAAFLGWTEEQKEEAGLARKGAYSQPLNPNASLRAPMSPFLRRVSSSASLNPSISLSSVFNSSSSLTPTPESAVESPGGKESLAELWSGFLERESASRDVSQSRRESGLSLASAGREPPFSPASGPSTPKPYGS